MAFTTTWARASARRRRGGLVGIALLLGIVGGLALATMAGARRTQSAYPRFLRTQNPSTLVVDVGSLADGGAQEIEYLRELPQVVRVRSYAAFYVAPWVNGGPDFDQNFEALASLDGRFFDQDQFTATSGRRPDPRRAEEVAVNETAAKRYGYHVGQRIDLATVSEDDLSDPAFAANPTPRLLTHATIVGIGSFIEEVVQD